jgi:tetratricopeptide (TPR) repeat protein
VKECLKIGILSLALLVVVNERGNAAAASPNNQWFQLPTKNFTILSSGPVDDVQRLAVKLEQFRQAYAMLAGAHTVVSVPIIVMAFPNSDAFRPFQPLYQGKPQPVAGFFQRDQDENLIALNLKAIESGSMEVIFHEYTHLLMRHNDRFWPLWLKEGMAEVYSTFAIENGRVCLGIPKVRHLEFLRTHPLMPLRELFRVGHDSAQYNEREQRGTFYAESWALTHYLALGDNLARKAQFGIFARKLHEAVGPEEAFAEAFQTEPASMEAELRQYLARGRFEPHFYKINTALDAEKTFGAPRALPQVELLFQQGNLFLHCNRLDEAEKIFKRAQRSAPELARAYEGLGLLAARRKLHQEAISHFDQAINRNSLSFRVYFGYARELYTSNAKGNLPPRNLSAETQSRIRGALQRSIQLMPVFAPAHHLLGVLELTHGENLVQAGQHLRRAVELDPENKNYVLALGGLQIERREYAAARQTLVSLLKPEVDPNVRHRAESLMKALDESIRPKAR